MNSESGWIKIHRKIIDNPIFLNSNLLQLFLYCILRANHKTTEIIFNGEIVKLDTGSFIAGRFQIAEDLKMNPSSVYKNLKKLQKLSYISLKSNNRFTIVTVIKYSSYQIFKNEKEQQSNNKVTTKEQQSNTDKNYKNDKNDKNKEKEVNNILIFPKNLKDIITVEIWEDWVKHRREIEKPLTESAVKKQVSFLLKQNNPIECIESSIRNGYTGLFEVKPSKNGIYKPKDLEPEKF